MSISSSADGGSTLEESDGFELMPSGHYYDHWYGRAALRSDVEHLRAQSAEARRFAEHNARESDGDVLEREHAEAEER